MPKAKINKGRGRAQGLNRDKILDAAAELLHQNPEQDPSISRIAAHLDVTPMAIYNHVDNRDHLMQCLAAKLFEDFHPALPTDDWREALRTWAQALHAYFSERPQLMKLLAWEQHTAAPYLEQMAQLLEVIPQGIAPAARRLQVVQWFMQSVLAFVSFELANNVRDYGISYADLDGVSPAAAQSLSALMPELQDYQPRRLFELNLEAALQAIDAMRDPATPNVHHLEEHHAKRR